MAMLPALLVALAAALSGMALTMSVALALGGVLIGLLARLLAGALTMSVALPLALLSVGSLTVTIAMAMKANLLDEDERRLSPLDASDCPGVLDLCQQHAELAAYQSSAVKNRLLVQADAQAMREWADGLDGTRKAAETEAMQRAACQALREPLVGAVAAPVA